MSIETRFCTYCGCPVGLHGEWGCMCEDNEGHAATKEWRDYEGGGGEYVCDCKRTRSEFNRHSGWSTFSFNMFNGARVHVELPF